VSLALNIGFGGFPLRVERVELLLQPRVGGYSRIDRATQAWLCRGGFMTKSRRGWRTLLGAILHSSRRQRDGALNGPWPSRGALPRLLPTAPVVTGAPFVWRSPKNRWPFQLVPVIALAICDRLPKFLPFQAKPSSRTMMRSSLPCHSRTSSAPGLKAIPSRVWASRRSNGAWRDSPPHRARLE